MKKLNSIQFYGMPLPIYAFFAIIVLACAYFNIIPNQMIGAVAVLFAFGILIGEIGERLLSGTSSLAAAQCSASSLPVCSSTSTSCPSASPTSPTAGSTATAS